MHIINVFYYNSKLTVMIHALYYKKVNKITKSKHKHNINTIFVARGLSTSNWYCIASYLLKV